MALDIRQVPEAIKIGEKQNDARAVVAHCCIFLRPVKWQAQA